MTGLTPRMYQIWDLLGAEQPPMANWADGTNTMRNVPVQVAGLTNVIAVTASWATVRWPPATFQCSCQAKLVASLGDLAAIPGNRLEALKRERLGQHSIRINDQWRICFTWGKGNAYDVEIADYH